MGIAWRVGGSLVLVSAGIAALPAFMWQPFPVPSNPIADGGTRATGVLHVHTAHSDDGGSSAAQVIQEAQAAGLDYVVITDHNNFGAKEHEGYAGQLLVIVGIEISTRCGHLLVFGTPEPSFRFSDDPTEVLEDVRDLGGVAVIAHPDSPRPELRWRCWDIPGAWGLELFNGDSQWRSASWAQTIHATFSYLLNPSYALLSILTPPAAAIERWNGVLSTRSIPIVAGADAHGYPSYESLFRLARTHVLLERPLKGDAGEDIAAVVTGIARGRAYLALDALAPANGFSFSAFQDRTEWVAGDNVPFTVPVVLRAGGNLPTEARVVLLRDGDVFAESARELEATATAPGVYRAEVYLPRWTVPWIVTNPIYVFDGPVHEQRERRGELAAPPEPPSSVVILDDFSQETNFVAAADRSTTIAHEVIDRTAGLGSTPAGRLQFKLGQPTAASASPFAALARAKPENWLGRHGLAFSLRGDGIYRLWVQVRDENPLSEGGAEWWYLSVKTSTQWQRVVLPFSRFRSADRNTDTRLDLNRVQGVFLILDTGVAKPDTEGTVWIDDFGVY